jgi:hypothetical protein
MFDKNIGKEARASLEFAEDSRETEWVHPSFAALLYQGKVKWDLMHPFPRQSDEDKKLGDAFLAKLEAYLEANYDADEVDKTGEIPDSVLKGLAELGCFAMKIPTQYNGLGLSQVNYNRAPDRKLLRQPDCPAVRASKYRCSAATTDVWNR